MLGAVLRRPEAMLVASAAAVALLLVGKAAALAALVHLVFTGTSDATVHFLIVIVSFVGAWSVLSSVHRAAVIAVVSRDATSVSSTRALLLALRTRASSILGLALALAVLDFAWLIATMLFLLAASRAVPSAGYFPASYALVWLYSRGLLGLAMSAVVLRGAGPFAALSRSVRMLHRKRLVTLLSRRAPAIVTIVAAAMAPESPANDLTLLLVALVDPVVVTIDATLEAAWDEELHPRAPDVGSLAATFE